MKKKRRNSELGHLAWVRLFILIIFAHGVVSGFPSSEAATKKTRLRAGISTLFSPAFLPNDPKIIERENSSKNENDVNSRRDNHNGTLQRNFISTSQTNISKMYHEAFLVLQELLKNSNRTNKSSDNFDSQRKMSELYKNNRKYSVRILGKSPLPPFKTRQNTSNFYSNKYLIGKQTGYSNNSQNIKNSSRGNQWKSLETPSKILGNLKLPKNQTNGSTFSERFWKSHKASARRNNGTVSTELPFTNKTRNNNMKYHAVNGSEPYSAEIRQEQAKHGSFFMANTSSSLFHLSKIALKNISNTSFKNDGERHYNKTLTSHFNNNSFTNNENNTGVVYQHIKNGLQPRNSTNKEIPSWKLLSSVELKTNSSHISSSLGNLMITQEIMMELGAKKDQSPTVNDGAICSTGDVYYNYTLSSRLKAGSFTEEEKAKTMNDCIYHCCSKRTCDVAFMIKESCFLVKCNNKQSCRSQPAHSSSFNPRLAYIYRQEQYTGDILPGKKDSFDTKNESKTHCLSHGLLRNMTLRSGLEAGSFTPYGEVRTFQECVNYCCKEKHCGAVFMVDNLCYSVRCKNKDSCFPIKTSNLRTTVLLAFVERGNNLPLIDVTDFKLQQQKHNVVKVKEKVKVPGSCSANHISSVLRNVKLRGGMKAGDFTYKGQVNNYRQCVDYCCKDELCNLALTLKNNCYLVACKTYKGCSTYPTLRTDFNPHIVYVNWEKISKKVLTKGNILYKTLGCWREDDSLERVVSLEGTDPVLVDSYKLRKNPVARCATAARKRSFKVFELHNGGECRSGFANLIYKRSERSDGCFNGGGGHVSSQVYYLKEDGTLGNFGCWKAIKNDEGFVTLESTDGRVMGSYKKRYAAFFKCAQAAMEQRYTLFALRDGGQCLGGFKGRSKYTKYGVSSHCKNGLGSDSSKSIYQIVGSATFQLKKNEEKSVKTTSREDAQFTAQGRNTDSDKIKSENKDSLRQVLRKSTGFSYKPGENVFQHGMKAGNFTSHGAVKNMDECEHLCGKQVHCSAAFMLRNYCFSVTCHSKESCATKPAEPSIFSPKVSFITHFLTINSPSTHLATPSKRCEAGRIYENVTLFGGINSGNFTDLGQRSNMNECIHQCCKLKQCNVAFMLGNDCYGVTCKTKQLCGTKPAKNVEKYKPRIAYLESDQEQKKDNPHPFCWNGEVLVNHTLTGGIDSGVFYSNGNTETMHTCMEYCCQQKDCDLAFRIEQGCYTVHCKDKEQCKPKEARQTNYRPEIAYKKELTFLHYDESKKYKENASNVEIRNSNSKFDDSTAKDSTNIKHDNGKTESVIMLPRVPHSCQVGPIHFNVTLKMGMHSGVFKKLERAEGMEDCIEMCCRETGSDAAFMLGKLCYSVKCYNSDLCQTRPAFISSINNLNINPAVAFLNMDTKEHADYTRSETEQRCVGTTVTENVTLLGGTTAGNFIDNGERRTIKECISACCNTPSCDVAFMVGKRCYSVECFNETVCEAVKAEATTIKPVIAYVARNAEAETQDLELSATDCSLESIDTLGRYQNKSLIGGFESGNYTFLGRTNNMNICIQKCCGLGKCDVAYSIDGNCYGIECFSKALCTIDDRTPDTTSTEISIIRNLNHRKLRIFSRYILPGLSALVAVVIIVGWIIWIRSKKIMARLK